MLRYKRSNNKKKYGFYSFRKKCISAIQSLDSVVKQIKNLKNMLIDESNTKQIDLILQNLLKVKNDIIEAKQDIEKAKQIFDKNESGKL
ncbi:hypothetical protein GVAV_000196 [Gurleya vavrai]